MAVQSDAPPPSLQAVAEGEELLISYGDRSDFELLQKYGFALGPANHFGPALQVLPPPPRPVPAPSTRPPLRPRRRSMLSTHAPGVHSKPEIHRVDPESGSTLRLS
jgi:hypothetical protein